MMSGRLLQTSNFRDSPTTGKKKQNTRNNRYFFRLNIITFTAVMPRHVGIMKTSESDGTKSLIITISTNTCFICFSY